MTTTAATVDWAAATGKRDLQRTTEENHVAVVVLRFEPAQAVVRVPQWLMELHPSGCELARQGVGIGRVDERVPPRPGVARVIGDGMHGCVDHLHHNANLISLQDREEGLVVRRTERHLEAEPVDIEGRSLSQVAHDEERRDRTEDCLSDNCAHRLLRALRPPQRSGKAAARMRRSDSATDLPCAAGFSRLFTPCAALRAKA